jgi:hypothetical protein
MADYTVIWVYTESVKTGEPTYGNSRVDATCADDAISQVVDRQLKMLPAIPSPSFSTTKKQFFVFQHPPVLVVQG